VTHIDLNLACLQLKTDCTVIMLILPLAVGNMSIAYKTTLYIIFTQATRVTDMEREI
jgi:hypothetical protein